jgi:hypothetical protein
VLALTFGRGEVWGGVTDTNTRTWTRTWTQTWKRTCPNDNTLALSLKYSSQEPWFKRTVSFEHAEIVDFIKPFKIWFVALLSSAVATATATARLRQGFWVKLVDWALSLGFGALGLELASLGYALSDRSWVNLDDSVGKDGATCMVVTHRGEIQLVP